MTQKVSFAAPDSEGLDAIIDSVAANPEKASQAKSMLRDAFIPRPGVLPFPIASHVANDDDDMWDNVPV